MRHLVNVLVLAALLAAWGCEGDVSSAPMAAETAVSAPPPPAPVPPASEEEVAAATAKAAADAKAQRAAAPPAASAAENPPVTLPVETPPAAPPAETPPANAPTDNPPAETSPVETPAATDATQKTSGPRDLSSALSGLKQRNANPSAENPSVTEPASTETPAAEPAEDKPAKKTLTKKAPSKKAAKKVAKKAAPGDDADTEKAQAGVGAKGRDYGGPGFVTTPIETMFRVEDRVVFEMKIPKALSLYKAEHNNKGPKSHEDFMKLIIKENLIQLPELPEGDVYWYNAPTEELLVRHPVKK